MHRRAALAILCSLPLTWIVPAVVPAARADDPASVSLWPGGPPGVQREATVQRVTERDEPGGLRDRYVTGITDPRLALFRPDQPDGSAWLILPGGGYQRVVLDKEGYETARWFASRGATCFVLTYRLPGEHWPAGPDAPLQDSQRAMRWIRQNADEFGIDPARVGVMGFSAGGHAAARLMTAYDAAVYEAIDDADRQSARPDFAALIYPVISMSAGLAHEGSKQRLLGDNPGADAIERQSPERQVDAATPPAFLLHAADDGTVPAANSVVMYQALKAAGVSAELHLFAQGGHGFGLRYATDKPVAVWPDLLLAWSRSLP